MQGQSEKRMRGRPGRGGPSLGKRLARPATESGAQGASRAGRRRRCAAKVCSPSSPQTGSESHRPPSGPARSWASGARPPLRAAPSGPRATLLPGPAAASLQRATPPLHAGSCSSRGVTHTHPTACWEVQFALPPRNLLHTRSSLRACSVSLREGSWVKGRANPR